MRALVLIGGVAVILLIAAGVYFITTRVRLAGPDETSTKPKPSIKRKPASK